MTAKARFHQKDVTKALNGALDAGLRPKSINIGPDGSINLEFEDPPKESAYDLWKASRASRRVELDSQASGSHTSSTRFQSPSSAQVKIPTETLL